MPYLLDLSYLLLLLLVWPWLVYQGLRKGKYRQGFAEKFLGRVPRRQGDQTCLWFHAVSVGEVNLIAPLVATIRRERPQWQCVVSTTTMTGFELAGKKYADLTVFYCPLDFSWATREAMRRVRPDLLVLVELELWPNLIGAAREAGARVAIVNGRLSQRSYRGYRRLGRLVARLLKQVDLIAAQNEEYAERFRALRAPARLVHVTGSLKFDGAQTDRRNPATLRLRQLAGITDSDIVFLAGSTQEPEEALALDAYRTLAEQFPQLRLVLVPRHPDRFAAVARMLEHSGLRWQRRSALQSPSPSQGEGCLQIPSPSQGEGCLQIPSPSQGEGRVRVVQPLRQPFRDSSAPPQRSPLSQPLPLRGEEFAADQPRIVLVDVIGELAAWWGAAHIAFVGGSMGQRGGQNMIEPAAYGAAVSFGPNTRNFRDVVTPMIAAEAAVVVHDGHELTEFVRRCLTDPHYARSLGGRAQAMVAGQLGATDRTFDLLAPLVESVAAQSTKATAA